jgi:uncharacterized protein (TIGR03086 family)
MEPTQTILDLGPATRTVAALTARVRDDQLTDPTPCPAYTVGDLLDHIGGLALAFTRAARKTGLGEAPGGPPPLGDAARLEPGWRERIARSLEQLAEAWCDPSAYVGETEAGGVRLGGAEAAVVALNEVVVHGWDLARASGQPYAVEDASVDACLGFAQLFSGPGTEELRGDAFGPVVAVPADASPLDRLIGLMGRDPAWRAG